MSALAGLSMLGMAALAAGKTPRAKMADVQMELDKVLDVMRRELSEASNGSETCVAAWRLLLHANTLRTLGMVAAGEGAPTNERFFQQLREIGVLTSLSERHCVRARAIRRNVMKAQIPSSRLDSGLSGATKVCVEYMVGLSGKVRCARWSSGPGYFPGPQEEDTYLIQLVRDFYANALCSDPTNSKKCGLARKYRYRRSLPYLPRNAKQARDILLPDVPGIEHGVVRIISLGPAPPLNPKRQRK
jgi:hypothetical protein